MRGTAITLKGVLDMPLPRRKKGESVQSFVNRFVGNDRMQREFSNQKQRVAVAYSQARRKGKK